jgi:hypothetical protein
MRILLGLAIVGLVAGATLPAQAENWCGFHQKANSQVRCGFSSLTECKQALGPKDKDVTCVPDPSSARAKSRVGNG